MHPLCCISLEGGGGGGSSSDSSPGPGPDPGPPEPALTRAGSLKRCSTLPGSIKGNVVSFRRDDVSVAGALFKWTNYSKGWRSRWFLLRGDGLLSYCKILSHHNLNSLSSNSGDDVTIIGDLTSPRLIRLDSRGRKKDAKKNVVVHLKVITFFFLMEKSNNIFFFFVLDFWCFFFYEFFVGCFFNCRKNFLGTLF